MAENSGIEWTTHTFNPWRGCTKVSAGCAHCYADTLSKRNPGTLGVWGPNGTRVVAAESYWQQPVKWDKVAAKAGERHRVFCASLADVFEGDDTMPESGVEIINDARRRLFDLIDRTPNLDWLLLTKRPENIERMMPPPSAFIHFGKSGGSSHANPNPFPHTTRIIEHGRIRSNLWLGTSVEDQKAADERIPHLLRVPAAVRFLSCEPLLGPVDLSEWIDIDTEVQHNGDGDTQEVHIGKQLHWVIVGGESGPESRPMNPLWARSLRDQCQAAGVPFFFKQFGEFGLEQIGNVRFTPVSSRVPMDEPTPMFRVGKKAAGRLLDGRTWSEFPTPVGG